MKHIFVNLKRFDVPAAMGGVNRLAPPEQWAETIISGVRKGLAAYRSNDASFTFFFPEAHLASAVAAVVSDAGKSGVASPAVSIGCQGVFWDDVVKGGNFGAFTSCRPAAAMKALGCTSVIIGHCEERRALAAVLEQGGVAGDVASAAVNRLLIKEIAAAHNQGLAVLYCIGEKVEEQERWQEVLSAQIEAGLSAFGADSAGAGANASPRLVFGYEPVWAIGPGKTPPDKAYIEKIARLIKHKTNGLPVVYGGGLKADNTAMLASIPEIDGGLIALTRFSGEIGFYPEEYLNIVGLYLGAKL
jgi:triosephosphate isomerase